jgi:hypothetical protein
MYVPAISRRFESIVAATLQQSKKRGSHVQLHFKSVWTGFGDGNWTASVTFSVDFIVSYSGKIQIQLNFSSGAATYIHSAFLILTPRNSVSSDMAGHSR